MQANKIKTGRKTVILKINFGLGNQLFLYAAGYALSRRLDAQLWMLFNEDTTKNVFIAQERSYSLDFFDVKYDFIIDEKEFLKIKSYTRVTEENFFEIGDINSRYFLIDDCFESEIYFINYKDEILKLFEFKDINIFNKPKIREFTQRIDNSHSVAVHIRRGDFKKDPSRIIPTSYQILTMQRLKQYIKRPKYFIFSDDPCLIKDMFLNLKDVSLVSDLESNSIEEFYLMQRCKHIITANSTYSWWAAYLNKNLQKKIFVPLPRYSPDFYSKVPGEFKNKKFNFSTEHAYPNGWININPFNF